MRSEDRGLPRASDAAYPPTELIAKYVGRHVFNANAITNEDYGIGPNYLRPLRSLRADWPGSRFNSTSDIERPHQTGVTSDEDPALHQCTSGPYGRPRHRPHGAAMLEGLCERQDC